MSKFRDKNAQGIKQILVIGERKHGEESIDDVEAFGILFTAYSDDYYVTFVVNLPALLVVLSHDTDLFDESNIYNEFCRAMERLESKIPIRDPYIEEEDKMLEYSDEMVQEAYDEFSNLIADISEQMMEPED